MMNPPGCIDNSCDGGAKDEEPPSPVPAIGLFRQSLRIGLAYDLRDDYLAGGWSLEEAAEFDRPETIDAVAEALSRIGHTVDRIGNVYQLVPRLAMGDRWDLVFNVAEGCRGSARESQVPGLLEAYGIPCTFSDALTLAVCLDKALTKTVAGAAGVPTAPFHVLRASGDIDQVCLPPPLMVKPLSEGTSKGIDERSIVRRAGELEPTVLRLFNSFPQGLLVEPLLVGREFTVGVLGTGQESRVLGTLEVLLQRADDATVYSWTNKELSEVRVAYQLGCAQADRLVGEVERVALAAWRALGCRDAGRVDVRCDALGRPQLLEINPLAGLHPTHSDLPILCLQLGRDFSWLIEQIVDSACRRLGHPVAGGSEVMPVTPSCHAHHHAGQAFPQVAAG